MSFFTLITFGFSSNKHIPIDFPCIFLESIALVYLKGIRYTETYLNAMLIGTKTISFFFLFKKEKKKNKN